MPERTLQVAADHPAFDGHFPGRPMLPGVALLAEVLESVLADPPPALAPSGAPLHLAQVKFLAPVGPAARLRIDWHGDAGALHFTVWQRAAADAPEFAAATGRFDAAG